VVLNAAAARKFYGGENPVGRRIQYNLNEWLIVGVVGSIRMLGAADEAPAIVYLSAEQQEQWPGYVLVKSTQPMETLLPAARSVVKEIDPTIAVTEVMTLDERVSLAMAPQRFRATVTTALGVLALLLSAIGIYGVISHAVGRETRDIGVRLALGEERQRIRARVLLRALKATGLGVVFGVALSLGASRWLASFMIGVSERDPGAIGVAALLLIGVAAVAAYLPARRASRVDPMIALRSD
jgi:ABC-type antimicrobial peptide transport system permease subunit